MGQHSYSLNLSNCLLSPRRLQTVIKREGCHTVVNMALSQLFWDVLMPWNLKSTYFSLKMIHFLSLNIWYVIYVVFWIKYWNLKLPHHCILFLFTICTVSQLFWNRVCMTFETCLVFMLYVDYGFNNNTHRFAKKHPYLSMPMLIRVLKIWKVLI